jgi:hypothetical protein
MLSQNDLANNLGISIECCLHVEYEDVLTVRVLVFGRATTKMF